MKLPVILAVLIGTFVLACSSSAPAPNATAIPEPTSLPTATAIPEPTSLPTATAIPEPTSLPTATALPEPTAVATSTPVPKATATRVRPTWTPVPVITPTPWPTRTPVPTLPAIPVDAADSPPYHGTVFFGHDFVTQEDPSYFVGLEERPSETRKMFDRRFGWITTTPYLFHATFSDGLSTEVQINPEFEDAEERLELATKYLRAIGQLPTLLRTDVLTVWIHEGDESFGGGNDNLLIHRERASTRENQGLLEEVLIHEAAHTSLDAYHKNTRDWLSAQTNDGQFISNYARDNPNREDLAESFPMWYALRHKTSRIPESTQNTILSTIPNRIQYFDTYISLNGD
jgi:hypothetical protein